MFLNIYCILNNVPQLNLQVGKQKHEFSPFITSIYLSYNRSIYSVIIIMDKVAEWHFMSLQIEFTVCAILYNYCDIIFIRKTFNFMYFTGRTIHEFKIPTKYFFTLDIFNIIWNSRIQVSSNMSIIVKPRNLVQTNLNDFTVHSISELWH